MVMIAVFSELPRLKEVGASCFNHRGYYHTPMSSFPTMSTSVAFGASHTYVIMILYDAFSIRSPSILIFCAAFWSRSRIVPQ